MSRPRAYSIARRISSGSCTPAPSSVNRRTPAPASSPNGASCSPRRPTVMHPLGYTSHSPALAPSSRTNSTTLRASAARVGVGHRHDGGVAAAGRRPGCPTRSSRRPRDQAGAGGRGGRRTRGRRRIRRHRAQLARRRGDGVVGRSRRCGHPRSPRARPVAVLVDEQPTDDHQPSRHVTPLMSAPPSPRRADRRARPSAPPRRC